MSNASMLKKFDAVKHQGVKNEESENHNSNLKCCRNYDDGKKGREYGEEMWEERLGFGRN